MCVKDEKEDIIKRSERGRERHKNGNASRFRERDGEKEDEKSYHFHIIVSKIQTRDTRPPKPTQNITPTNARKQRERKKEHVYNNTYLETG